MHICFVAERFHPPWIEGYQNILREIVSLLKKDVEISVVSLRTDSEHVKEWQDESSDLDIYHIGVSELRHPNEILHTGKVLKLLQSITKKKKIDGIHVHNVKKGLFSLSTHCFLRIPVIVQVSKSLIPYNADLRSKISAGLNIQMMKHSGARAFVVTSSSLKREMESLGFSTRNINYIPPAIDTDKFRPMNRKRLLLQNGFGAEYFYIGYLGRIAPGRGVMELLDAFKRLTNEYRNIRLILAITTSDAKYRKMPGQYIKGAELSSHTICLGTSNAVEKIYNMLDLVVVPLTHEAAVDPPLTLLEAMSCEKAVIASKIGDIPKIIKDGENGYLVNPGDVDELHKTMRSVVTRQETLDKIGSNARKTILEKFSGKTIAKQHLELYSKL